MYFQRLFLATALALAPIPLVASLTTIFAPDFNGVFQGTGNHQFNYVGSAEDGQFASFSGVDGWFRMVTNHQEASAINQSATRLSRHGGSTSANALPFEENFALISLAYRFTPVAWTGSDRSVLNVTVGQNFRSGAFNPARGGAQPDGPAFANLNVQARTTEHQFRVIAGGGPGSSNFTVTPDAGGAYNLALTVALNNTLSARTFDSPTGSHTLESGRASVWANGELVWDNYDHNNLNKSAEFQHVSFAFGNGTFADFATAQALGGVYELRDIVVRTGGSGSGPMPTPPAAPSGLTATAVGSNQINLTWSDNSTNESGFRIERSIGGGTFSLLANTAANLTSFSDTGLAASTLHSYRVQAENAAGSSAFSNTASATTGTTPVDPDPNPVPGETLWTNAVGTGNLSAAGNWSNGLPTRANDRLGRFNTPGTFTLSPGNFNSYLIRQDQGGIVFSAGNVGLRTGEWELRGGSMTVDGQINLGTGDADTQILAVNGGNLSVSGRFGVIRGTTLTLGSGVITGEEWLNIGTNGSVNFDGGTSSWVGRLQLGGASGLDAGTLTINGGNHTVDGSLVINAEGRLRFGAGGSLTASTSGSINGKIEFLEVSPATLTIANRDEAFFQDQYAGGAINFQGTNNRPFAEVFIVHGATLRPRLSSDPAPPVLPASPFDFTATVVSPNQINLSWADNSDNETGFRIERSVGQPRMWGPVTVTGPNATSFTDIGLTPLTAYFYRIRAENNAGASPWSYTAEATTLAAPDPVDPIGPGEGLPHGYINVLAFGADPTGELDSTAALQQAINHGRDNRKVVWFPVGTYLVSGRLEVDQPDNDANFPAVLMGSTVDPERRAVIRLAPNSPGFNDPNNRRVVLHYFNIGTANNEGGNTDLYSQAIISVDFEIGAGNDGAVALRMQGAEGCTIEDVRIDLTEGGHTGIWGIPGSGGATHSVTIIGGVIGIDTRTRSLGGGGSQPSPVVTGSRFINQSDRAVFASARGSLVMVGCHFERSTGGPLIRVQGNWVGQPFDGSFQLIDSVIEYASFASNNTVIDFAGAVPRSFYLDNTYVRNARRVVIPAADAGSGWTHFHRLAVHNQPQSRGWGQPAEPVYIDGQLHGDFYVDMTAGDEPPAGFLGRHRLPEDFPTWETPGVVSVRDLGAVGDGVADDWAVLQGAIDNHEIIFLPAGVYAVSRTLNLHPDTKIIGSHPTFTAITAISTLQNRFNGIADGEPDAPIIRSADVAGAETWLAHFQIRRVYPLAQHNPTPPGNFALEWRSGGASLVRQLKVESRTATNFRPDFAAANFYGIDIIANPIDPNHSQRSFGEGQWAWPNDHPNVLITGNGGGRWYTFWFHGRQGLRENTPFLRVENTVEPLHIYHLHMQQQHSRNHGEFIGARNVSVYNTKGELKGALLYFENCDNVRVFGNGGLTSPNPDYFDPYLFRFINTTNFLISGQSDTINEGASRWIGGPFDRWIHANLLTWYPVQDAADDRPDVIVPSEHRPILYLRGNPGFVPFTPVEAPPTNPWTGATPLGGGFYSLDWFGIFRPFSTGWLFHLEHGWLYTPSTSAAALWLWHPPLGWIYTSNTIYPFVFRAEAENWLLYLRGGEPGALWFYDFSTEAWEFVD